MKYKIVKVITLLVTLFSLNQVQANQCEMNMESDNCIKVSVHDGSGAALADVVVYLQPLQGQKTFQSTKVVTIGQKGKKFTPYISVSQTNNSVNFVNSDDITHHIYSAGGSTNFAFKIKAGSEQLVEHFDHQTEVAMGCNIHDWMSGSLLIVDTPYFAKTDSNGVVAISLEELGSYKIVVWHPQLNIQQHRVSQEFNLSQNSSVNIVIPQPLDTIPKQSSNDDFEFVSDY